MVAISNALHGLFAGAAASSSYSSYSSSTQNSYCNVSTFVPDLPSGETALVPPTNITPSFIGLAFGVQNYTCTSGNNYTNVGAVAELFDISCIVGSPDFFTNQDTLFNSWNIFDGLSIQDLITFLGIQDIYSFLNPGVQPQVLAQHYFVTNPTTGQGVSPKWDFTSSGKFKGNPDAFIVAKGLGTLPAPTNATADVAWLQVTNVEGSIADQVFRIDTKGGQPPAHCTFGQSPNISVKYTSKYVFYGGSLAASA